LSDDKAVFFPDDRADENLVGPIDWAKIEAEYRAGKTLRAISEQFGIGKDAISRKAKREGWERGAPRQDRDKAATSDVVSPLVSPVVAPETNDRAFDWEADDIIVLHEQPRTAIYWNPNGALVIRQQNWPDEDVFVLIAREYLATFIDELTDFVGIPLARRLGDRTEV
jgi:hypothetical protein